ncbi:MAG: hypothetical protein KF830_06205 [Planctomycetes bacterium]|nr:hypothetical protein [Planctomycetota bacterium]
MQVGQFPAAAASSLIEGYCDDFVALASTLAQTLEQVSMRGIDFEASRPSLQRIEQGMRDLAEAIHELLQRGPGAGGAGARPARAREAGDAPAVPPTRPAAPARSRTPNRVRPAVGPSAPNPRPPVEAAARPGRRRLPPGAWRRAAGALAGSRNSTLKGTNRTMPLLSVFQFLGRTRKSGTVHVWIGDETLAFEFVNGCIEFTASNRCPVAERLGELLVELGFATREGLAPVLAKVGVSSAHRLGHLVVESRLVSNGQVLEALETQVKRRFQRVCSNPEAAYEFEEGRRLPGDGRIRITPFELSFEPGRVDRGR